MKRILFFICIVVMSAWAPAQVVTTDPSLPVETDEVVITFHADEGSGGLEDHDGEVYAHTGVITSESSGDSDWKYVVTDWGENTEETKLKKIDANTWELTITPDVRSFYDVPDDEDILKMAFVFRSGEEINDSYKEGKAEGGDDIFVEIHEEGLKAVLSSPSSGALFDPGATVEVTGSSQEADLLELFLDGDLQTSTQDQELTYSFDAPLEGSHQLVLRATDSDSDETEADTVDFYIREPVVEEPLPAGMRKGINIVDDNTVTLVLQAPDKSFVYAIGDFNGWEPRPEAQMKKDGEFFWITLTGLNPDEEYAYQYYIDGEVKVADPYTNKVLDPWNDGYIPDRIYPDLKPYPDAKGAEGIVSVFTPAPEEYQWQVNDFNPPPAEDLVIYEMLIRDFTENQDIKTVTDTLDYLERLGVNAIELMPFNEFEGNDSWGYNPSFYFATDKAYGTLNDYKEFVDECHARGIAVIMDLVLNHSYSQSPLVQMYMDGEKPADNNPWYNRDHNMDNTDAHWGYDFDHESPYTQELVDSINAFWMSELRIDGFRFDFTKGFTNSYYGPDSWASSYDADRIAILNRMSEEIWKRNSDALVIFEHLSDNSEEKELAENGVLMWGNMNHPFSEAVMGYNENGNSDFSWASYQERDWEVPHLVAYMESHDEERIMYRALNNGNSSNGYDVRESETALMRSAMASVFLMSIPGPKMIWQFGEMGYDVSIDEGGRLGQKPPKWEYLDDYARESLWRFYANIIQLKTREEVFSTQDYQMNVSEAVKRIMLNGEEVDIRLIGNFGMEEDDISPVFSKTGWWYDHFQGDSIEVTNENMQITLDPGEFIFYTSKKLEGFRNVTSSGPEVPLNAEEAYIFPNPAGEEVRVHNPGETQLERIVVYDLSGRVVLKKTSTGEESFNVAGLPRGYYLFEGVFEDGNRFRRKMFKR
ncbi:MAG: alpha-amylase family glycosyl hydrolase [Marinilabilia sp.]